MARVIKSFVLTQATMTAKVGGGERLFQKGYVVPEGAELNETDSKTFSEFCDVAAAPKKAKKAKESAGDE